METIRFWNHVLAALESACPEASRAARKALRQSPAQVPRAALRLLLNAICLHPAPIVLVLDDLHLLKTQELFHGLSFLLEHVGCGVHLVLASREEAPLAVARLRASGALLELRSDVLRFSPEEARSFLEQTMALRLDSSDLSLLASRTEG